MADNKLKNDEVLTIPIVSRDAQGDIVPSPAGVVYTAVNDRPDLLNSVIDGSNLVLNALLTPIDQTLDINVTVDDNGPLAAKVIAWNIVEDNNPTAVDMDTLHATSVAQPPAPAEQPPAPAPAPTP